MTKLSVIILILILLTVTPFYIPSGENHIHNVFTSSSNSKNDIGKTGTIINTVLLNNGTVLPGRNVLVTGVNALTMFVSPINGYVIIPMSGHNGAIVYDPFNLKIIKRLNLSNIDYIFFSNRTNLIYMFSTNGNSSNSTVYAMNARNFSITTKYEILPQIYEIAYSWKYDYFYVAFYNGTLGVYNLDFRLIETINLQVFSEVEDTLTGKVIVFGGAPNVAFGTAMYILNNLSAIYVSAFQFISLYGTIAFDNRSNAVYLSGYNHIWMINATNGNVIRYFYQPYASFQDGVFLQNYIFYNWQDNLIYDVLPDLSSVYVMNTSGVAVESITTGIFDTGYVSGSSISYNIPETYVAMDPLNSEFFILNSGSGTLDILNYTEYNIKFLGKDITSGIRWGVFLNGIYESTTAEEVNFIVGPGNYTYKVTSPSNFIPNPSSGDINLTNNNIVISINFTSPYIEENFKIYDVGLSLGQQFSVKFNNVTFNHTVLITGAMNFDFLTLTLPMGTYNYTIYSAGHVAVTAKNFSGPLDWSYNFIDGNPVFRPYIPVLQTLTEHGVVRIDGQSFILYFNVRKYQVTFDGLGILPGTYWMVNLSGNIQSSRGNSISYFLSNGTYEYSIYTDGSSSRVSSPFKEVIGYNVTPDRGNITVKGSDLSIIIRFVNLPNYYWLNITVRNYPTFYPLFITVNNISEYSILNHTIFFRVKKGNYQVGVHKVNLTLPYYFQIFSNGSNSMINENLTISGNTIIYENFTAPTLYNAILFSMHGGYRNSIEMMVYGNSTFENFLISTNGSALEYLPPGSYFYQIEQFHSNFSVNASMVMFGPVFLLTTEINAFPIPPGYINNGYFNSTKMNSTVNITLLAYFAINFQLNGAQYGTPWQIKLNNDTYNETKPFATIWVENGVYDYYVSTPENMTEISNSRGVLIVNNSSLDVNMTLLHLYYLTITENGLVNDTRWGIVIGNQSIFTNNETILLEVPDGNYTLKILTVNGYSTSKEPINVSVNGTSLTINIDFIRVKQSNINSHILFAAAIISAVMIILGTTAFIKKRQRGDKT